MDISIITSITKRIPSIVPLLRGRALVIALSGADPEPYDETKTVATYYRSLSSLVRAVYAGVMYSEFIDLAYSVMNNELNQAKQAAYDAGGVEPFPEAEDYVDRVRASEASFLPAFYEDIQTARANKSPIEPLLARCQVWANRWNDVYNSVLSMISAIFGEKQIWVLGQAEHCNTCRSLNGIVAYAKEWQELGVSPQNPPNTYLDCGGWNCKCALVATDQRKTRNATQRIYSITRGGW